MGNTNIPADTTTDAAFTQFTTLQKLDVNARAQMTFQLSDNLRATVEAGVRHRHPDYNKKKVMLAVMQLTLGKRLFRQAFGDVEVKV